MTKILARILIILDYLSTVLELKLKPKDLKLNSFLIDTSKFTLTLIDLPFWELSKTTKNENFCLENKVSKFNKSQASKCNKTSLTTQHLKTSSFITIDNSILINTTNFKSNIVTKIASNLVDNLMNINQQSHINNNKVDNSTSI